MTAQELQSQFAQCHVAIIAALGNYVDEHEGCNPSLVSALDLAAWCILAMERPYTICRRCRKEIAVGGSHQCIEPQPKPEEDRDTRI